MAYKLIEAAQTRWRAVNAPHLVALVRNAIGFVVRRCTQCSAGYL
jgi:hypothetical protein